jgi:hypothetical protein
LGAFAGSLLSANHQYVWENREDVIYHDLSYGDKTIEAAPEIVPFMHRVWVFNRAMQWHRESEGILCYSPPATLRLTGDKAVSAWHSDPANELTAHGEYILFMKACRLSSKSFCLLIFSFSANNILLCRYLSVVNVPGHARQFRRTVSTRRGKSQSYPRPFSP